MMKVNKHIILLCALLTLAAAMALISTVRADTSDTFPNPPYNNMQITYTITGATLSAPQDSPGDTWERDYTGTLALGSTLTVSGSLTADQGLSADASVTVSVDSNTQTQPYSSPSNYNPPTWVQPFSVSVPIPSDAQGGSFSIDLTE